MNAVRISLSLADRLLLGLQQVAVPRATDLLGGRGER
jgi:hypothetical protein